MENFISPKEDNKNDKHSSSYRNIKELLEKGYAIKDGKIVSSNWSFDKIKWLSRNLGTFKMEFQEKPKAVIVCIASRMRKFVDWQQDRILAGVLEALIKTKVIKNHEQVSSVFLIESPKMKYKTKELEIIVVDHSLIIGQFMRVIGFLTRRSNVLKLDFLYEKMLMDKNAKKAKKENVVEGGEENQGVGELQEETEGSIPKSGDNNLRASI
jgi:hypothetical protein